MLCKDTRLVASDSIASYYVGLVAYYQLAGRLCLADVKNALAISPEQTSSIEPYMYQPTQYQQYVLVYVPVGGLSSIYFISLLLATSLV